IQRFFAEETAASREISNAQKAYSNIQATLYKAVAFGFAGLDAERAANEINRKLEKRAELDSFITTAPNRPMFADAKSNFETIKNQSEGYFKWVEQVAENLDDPSLAAANMVTTEARFDSLSAAFNEILLLQEKRVSQTTTELSEKLSSLLKLQIVMTLLIAVITIGVSFLNLRLFTSFVFRLREGVKRMAEGDLSEPLEVKGGDELAELAVSLEEMRIGFLKLLNSLKQTCSRLSDSSAILTGVSGQLKTEAGTVDNRTGIISIAGREVNEHARMMSSGAQTIAQGANTTSAAITEMQKTIQEISQNCIREEKMAKDTTLRVKETLTSMSSLEKATKEIDSILKVIDDIAGRTRLLALNATIEAASAGNAGKGFAVVAAEVRELAAKSNNAAEQIQSKIAVIRQQTGSTIGSMTEVSRVFEEFTSITSTIASAIEEQAVTVSEISSSMSNVSRSIDTLVSGIDDVADRSDRVQNAIRDVEGASANTLQKAGEASASADTLNAMAAELSGNISRFKLQ
ncbi:MAG: HAMP domain-containing protein, partial [Fibrobacteres bacterium]|nr:HAMP domain-containing protein [Fibrobacterota bacterium]